MARPDPLLMAIETLEESRPRRLVPCDAVVDRRTARLVQVMQALARWAEDHALPGNDGVAGRLLRADGG